MFLFQNKPCKTASYQDMVIFDIFKHEPSMYVFTWTQRQASAGPFREMFTNVVGVDKIWHVLHLGRLVSWQYGSGFSRDC